jgi:hypothetical protein
VTLLSDLVRADQGAHTGPDPVDRIAEHGAGRSADSRPPEQPVANPAGAASSASVRISHDLVSIAALGEVPP